MESKKSSWGIASSRIIPLPQKRPYVWQHLILLVIRQNEGKLSMFSGFLIEEASAVKSEKPRLHSQFNRLSFQGLPSKEWQSIKSFYNAATEI